MASDWNETYEILRRSNVKYPFYLCSYDYQDFNKGKTARLLDKPRVGWARRAVDIRANKTKFDCFENDTLKLNELFEKYGVIKAFNKIKKDILICGCGFLALNNDRVVPFTAEQATGKFSWDSDNLSKGLAIYQSESRKGVGAQCPDVYVRYLPDETIIYEKGEIAERMPNPTGRPMIGLLTHEATTKRPFGQSVIDTAARSAIIDGSRTMRQAMIAGYHYNVKVDAILGVDNETDIDKVESQTGDILKIGANSNGQIPQIGEFSQHAMQPFNDTLLMAARNFCAATKLSLANLAESDSAPQSTESLEIVNDDLQDAIRDWQDELGEQLKYFAVTLFMHENSITKLDDNMRAKIRETRPVFLPIYRQDVSKFGDGLTKIAQNAPEIVSARSIWRNIGLTSEEIDRVVDSAQNTQLLG